MPELPEVETVLRGLKRRVLGARIADIQVRDPRVIAGAAEEFARQLEGRAIAGFKRKGKTLAVELAGENGAEPRYLLIRLGMTGSITVGPRSAALLPHTHVVLPLAGRDAEIRYRDPRRFGRLRLCTPDELRQVFARLGPDAPTIREADFLNAMRGRRGAIKSWLLNQAVLAGVGNIYADEALFAARLHPLVPAGRISRAAARRLLRALKTVLRRAVELQGTSFRDYIDIEGRPGRFRPRLRVYQREGEPCPRCAARIRRLTVAGRSSHYCPRCQRRPRRGQRADESTGP